MTRSRMVADDSPFGALDNSSIGTLTHSTCRSIQPKIIGPGNLIQVLWNPRPRSCLVDCLLSLTVLLAFNVLVIGKVGDREVCHPISTASISVSFSLVTFGSEARRFACD